MTAIAGVDGSGFRQIIPAADPTSEKEISELLEISLNEHRRRLFNPRLSLKLRSALMYRIPAPKKKGGGDGEGGNNSGEGEEGEVDEDEEGGESEEEGESRGEKEEEERGRARGGGTTPHPASATRPRSRSRSRPASAGSRPISRPGSSRASSTRSGSVGAGVAIEPVVVRAEAYVRAWRHFSRTALHNMLQRWR